MPETVVSHTLRQAHVILVRRIRRMLVPLRYWTKPLSLVLSATARSFFLSCISSSSVHMWSVLENSPPPITSLISSALPCLGFRYFYLLTSLNSRDQVWPSWLALYLDFLRWVRGFLSFQKYESFYSLPQTHTLCPRWRVVEISYLIGLHIPLQRNSPRDIPLQFFQSC